MTLTYTFFYLEALVICISFIVSVFFCFKSYNPTYLRLFPLYNLLAIITEFIAEPYFSKISNSPTYTHEIPYNLFSIAEFLFLTYLITNIISEKKYRLVLFTFAAICSLIFIYVLFNYSTFLFPTRYIVLPLNIYYIIIFTIYLHYIFYKAPFVNLLKEPSFFIAIGILFYAVVDTPAWIFCINKSPLSDLLYTLLNATAYIVLHLSFIKAYTCKAQK